MTSQDSRAFDAALRSDLHTFTAKSFQELHPGKEFFDCWYFRAVTHALTLVAEGKLRRLAIALPPRHGKSLTASVAFTAWLLGRDPALHILCASYSQPLATELSRQTRNIMQSSFYRRAFPRTLLSGEKSAEDEFETSTHGKRLAVSVGGTVLGRGGDILIGDDLMHPNDLRSPEAARKVIDWFRSVFLTRLNDPRHGSIIIIGQRLHENDVIGHIEREGGWHILRIPAIAEEEETFDIGNDETYHRRAEEILHPQHMDRESLDRQRI